MFDHQMLIVVVAVVGVDFFHQQSFDDDYNLHSHHLNVFLADNNHPEFPNIQSMYINIMVPILIIFHDDFYFQFFIPKTKL